MLTLLRNVEQVQVGNDDLPLLFETVAIILDDQ